MSRIERIHDADRGCDVIRMIASAGGNPMDPTPFPFTGDEVQRLLDEAKRYNAIGSEVEVVLDDRGRVVAFDMGLPS